MCFAYIGLAVFVGFVLGVVLMALCEVASWRS